MIPVNVKEEKGDSHMITRVTDDMKNIIDLMNDYNFDWRIVYNIVKDSINIERFEFVKGYNGNSFLIDKQCKLPGIPLGFDIDDLNLSDKESLNKWLNFLNKMR